MLKHTDDDFEMNDGDEDDLLEDDDFGLDEDDDSFSPAQISEVVEKAIDLPIIAKPEKTARQLQKEAKQTRDFRKKYFSSLTARRSHITYFGVGDTEHTLMQSNTAGNYFSSVMAAELGFHVIHFKKEWERVEDLKQDLLLTDPKKVYIANIPAFLAQVNKFKLDNVRVWKTEDRKIVCTKKDTTEFDPKKQLVAYSVSNFHLLSTVQKWYDYVKAINEEHAAKHPHQWMDLNKDPNVIGITVCSEIDITKFLKSDGSPVFTGYVPILQPILFDGIGTPSTKEFVKKQENSTYKLYAWVEEDAYVRIMTVYEDDTVLVKSMKPNLCFYPMPLSKLKMNKE